MKDSTPCIQVAMNTCYALQNLIELNTSTDFFQSQSIVELMNSFQELILHICQSLKDSPLSFMHYSGLLENTMHLSMNFAIWNAKKACFYVSKLASQLARLLMELQHNVNPIQVFYNGFTCNIFIKENEDINQVLQYICISFYLKNWNDFGLFYKHLDTFLPIYNVHEIKKNSTIYLIHSTTFNDDMYEIKFKMNNMRMDFHHLMTMHQHYQSEISCHINELQNLTLVDANIHISRKIHEFTCKNRRIEEFTDILRNDMSKYKVRIGSERMRKLLDVFNNLDSEKKDIIKSIQSQVDKKKSLKIWIQSRIDESVDDLLKLQDQLTSSSCSPHMQHLLGKLNDIVQLQDEGEYSFYNVPMTSEDPSLRPFLEELKIKSQTLSSQSFFSSLEHHQRIKKLEESLLQNKNSDFKQELIKFKSTQDQLLKSIAKVEIRRDYIDSIHRSQEYHSI